MNEINLTRKIQAMIEKEFPNVYCQRVSDRFLSGIPDLRLVVLGFSLDIEIKLPGKGKKSDPDPIQEKVMGWIRKAGGETKVARSVDEVRVFLRYFESKCRAFWRAAGRQVD